MTRATLCLALVMRATELMAHEGPEYSYFAVACEEHTTLQNSAISTVNLLLHHGQEASLLVQPEVGADAYLRDSIKSHAT